MKSIESARTGNVHYGYEKDAVLSFSGNGRKVTTLVTGIMCEDGKLRIPVDTYDRILRKLNLSRGQTYSIG